MTTRLFARHVTAYFAAYVASFTALERLEPLWASLVMTAVAALAFAVTLNGRKSLLSAEYARTAGATFMAVAAIWLIYQLLLLAGIDLLAEDFKSASEMFTVVPESEA